MEVAISTKRQFSEVMMVRSENTEGLFKMIFRVSERYGGVTRNISITEYPKNHHGISKKNIPCFGNDKERPKEWPKVVPIGTSKTKQKWLFYFSGSSF